MPIIVPIEENHEGIAGLTDAKFRAPDYSGSGLEALGAGMASVGQGGAELAHSLSEQRAHRDDAAIKQAFVGFGNQADPVLHDYFTLSGSAARAAQPQVEADLQAAGQAQIDALGNDRRRAMIAQQLAQRIDESIAAVRSHAALQDVAAQAQQSQAFQERNAKDALNNIDKPELYEHHIETGKNAVRQQARLAGQPPAQGEEAAGVYQSAIHLAHVDTRATDDAVGAMVAVRRHGADMQPDDMRKALTGVAPRFAQERAFADVDAGDLAAASFAPTTPKMAPDDLRDRMLVISENPKQTGLAGLLQRYKGDAARSWAAAAIGPDKFDALVAQRGDGWYRALPEDVRLDVARHMALLGARNSPRTVPADAMTAATRIINQSGDDDERKQHALDELNWRITQADRSQRATGERAAGQAMAIADRYGDAFSSIAQIPPALRRDLRSDTIDDLAQRAHGNMSGRTVAFAGEPGAFRARTATATNGLGSGDNQSPPANIVGAGNQISSPSSIAGVGPSVDPQASSNLENVIGLRSMDAGARNDVPRDSDADAGGMSHVDALRASFMPAALQVLQGKPAGGAPSAGNPSGAASTTNDDNVAADGLTSKHLAPAANGGPDQAGARIPIISDSTLAALRAKAASPQRQARNRAQAAEDLRDPVVVTLLHMIAYYEGPDRANGYAQIQGKLKKTDPQITDFSRFPDIGDIAGGRYQIERKNMYATGVQDLGIESFNPVDQDMMATYVLRHYGVIDKIKAGDFAGAMPALAKYWRSLPLPGRDSGVSGDARGSFPTFVKIFNELYPLVQAEQERHLVYDNGLRYLAPLAPMMPGVDKVAAAMRGHQDLRGVLDKYRLFDKKK